MTKAFFDQYVVMILLRSGSYHMVKYPSSKWDDSKGKRQIVYAHEGHHYILDRSQAKHLKGWNPWFPRCWLSCYADLMPYPRRGLLVFRQPASPLKGIEFGIRPLDRLENIDIVESEDADGKTVTTPRHMLNPQLYKTLQENRLMRDAIRHTPFGGLGNWKLTTFVLIGLIALMVLLYMGGYFE